MGRVQSPRRVAATPCYRRGVAAASDDTPTVDTTLIDEMLRLTPTERLRLHDRVLATARLLREAAQPPSRSDAPAPERG